MTTIPVGFMNNGLIFNNDLFMTAGGANINDNYVYSVNTNNWVQKASKPTGTWRIDGQIIDGKIICVGGFPNNVATNNVEIYDIASDTWTTSDSSKPEYDSDIELYPVEIQGYCSCVIDNSLYVFGGKLLSGYVTNLVYKMENDGSWIPKQSLNTADWRQSVSVVNGKAYITGGQNNGTSVEEYDPATDQMTTMSVGLPSSISGHCSAAIGSKIYIFGSNTVDVIEYDLTNYPTITSNIVPAYACPIQTITAGSKAVNFNDDIYIIRAYNKRTRFHKFNPNDTVKWINIGDAPYNNFGYLSFVVNN